MWVNVYMNIDNFDTIKESLIDQHIDAAELMAANHGYKIRIVSKDGQHLIVTRDVRVDRINVEVTNKIITNVRSIG